MTAGFHGSFTSSSTVRFILQKPHLIIYSLITTRIRRMMRGNVFSLLSVHRGLPHPQPIILLHPIKLPLVPCPFQGVPHPLIFPLVPCPFWRDTPLLARGYYMTKVPPGQDGVPPSKDRMKYPLARSGVPPSPQNGLCLDRLYCGGYASCGFLHENFLVTYLIHILVKDIKI